MKRTLLAITLAAATVPFTFARTPQTSNPSGDSQPRTEKKHKKTKKNKKSTKPQGSTETPAPQQK